VARRRNTRAAALQEAQAYRHPEAESPLRPDVGTQSQFKKKKPPVTYRKLATIHTTSVRRYLAKIPTTIGNEVSAKLKMLLRL